MEYLNESTIISLPTKVLELSFFDEEKRKFIVKESHDDGNTWVTVREYDSIGLGSPTSFE